MEIEILTPHAADEAASVFEARVGGTMSRWIGPATYLFIPLVVKNREGYDDPPEDYREFVRRRVYFDRDPETQEDRSLMSYISSISYGQASLDATVCRPVTLDNLKDDDNPTLEAIYAQPDAHLFEYIAVVYPPNRRGAGAGMHQPGQIQFPEGQDREPNLTKARSRFRHDDPIGTWAMEVLHNVTEIGDYYNNANNPERFDEMAAAAATHPSSYTKLRAGWLDSDEVPTHKGGRRTYTLHALGLPQPPPGGRLAGLRVPAFNSNRSVYIEARLRSDRWDRGFSDRLGSLGIPSEGVVIYEFAPESDPWPRLDPNGPWPPLELRTPTALMVGQTFVYRDARTTVRVTSGTAGGFIVELETDDVTVPFVEELRETAAAARIRAVGLQPRSTGASGQQAWVFSQSPKGGTRVPPGSTVTLQLRTGPIP
jgi:hypothetical protein